jgi:hypothetical protein
MKFYIGKHIFVNLISVFVIVGICNGQLKKQKCKIYNYQNLREHDYSTTDYTKMNYSILIAFLSLSIGILMSALALLLITMFGKYIFG